VLLAPSSHDILGAGKSLAYLPVGPALVVQLSERRITCQKSFLWVGIEKDASPELANSIGAITVLALAHPAVQVEAAVLRVQHLVDYREVVVVQ
jgi:hypothetical protein